MLRAGVMTRHLHTKLRIKSNTDVATVSAKGLVTAASVGTAVNTVTLQTEDGTIYATNSTKVFVKKNAVSVERRRNTNTHPQQVLMPVSHSILQLKRTAADEQQQHGSQATVITDYVKYESSDEKFSTVDKFA